MKDTVDLMEDDGYLMEDTVALIADEDYLISAH